MKKKRESEPSNTPTIHVHADFTLTDWEQIKQLIDYLERNPIGVVFVVDFEREIEV